MQQYPGLRSSLEQASEFTVVDTPDGAVLVEPAEGAGTVRRYFDVTRVANVFSDLTDDRNWAPLAIRPPFSPKPEIPLPADASHDLERLQNDSTLPALMQRLGIEVSMTEPEGLADIFRRELPGLFARYPGGSLWYVGVDPVLVKRLTFMRVALQLRLTPDARWGNQGDGGTYFDVHQLSRGLAFSEVVQPILLTFAPVVSGFVMNAPPGAFVFLFGQFDDEHDMRARDGDISRAFFPAVNVHLFSPGVKVPMLELPSAHVEGLLGWWASRLDVLYSHAADPTRFATAAGDHDVEAQAAWFFTFERLLADVEAMTASVNSPGLLRMQGAFDALDKAAGLLVGPRGTRRAEAEAFCRLLRRRDAMPRVERAMSRLPLQMHSRFRAWTRGAFDALYADIRAQTMPHRTTTNGVRVGHDHATDLREMTWDDYVAELIREARNASHGLNMLTEDRRGNRRDRRLLLATNEGDVPASLYEVVRAVTFGLFADAEAFCDRTW
jgi:hypothetical protein